MNFYLQDVLTQKDELLSAMEFYFSEETQKQFLALRQLPFRKILFSGMGSSHFCAIAADIYLKQHGIDSAVVSTGELLYYELQSITPDTLLCLISQSGESAETIHLLELLPPQIKVVAITNNPDSTLGRRGDFLFPIHVSDEKSVTTRTYLGSILLTLLLAFVLSGKDFSACREELVGTIHHLGDYLVRYQEQMEQMMPFVDSMTSVSVLGRGYATGTVQAGALFFREVVRFPALDFDCAEFKHGPMEMVQADFYAVVLAPAGKTQALNVNLAKAICEKGGNVILITDDEAESATLKETENILVIQLPTVAEYLTPLLQIAPIQLLANILAEKRGVPVGEFRWGNKIMTVE